MLERILPGQVAIAEAFDDRIAAPLFEAEEAVIKRAVAKRRREFATVRRCARQALADLDVPPAPIIPGARGAPRWPAGAVGSMTHCDGYRAAAVARAGRIASIGIDAEPHGPLPSGVLDMIALAEEHRMIAELPVSDGVRWDRLLFSAKEAVYKAWFPLTRRWLGFEDAAIRLDPAGGFHARLLIQGPVTEFTGRWLLGDGLLITAIAEYAGARIPARRAPARTSPLAID